MLGIPRILTRVNGKRQVVLCLNLTQKIVLTLLVVTLATMPLWLGSERVHSAPAIVATPPLAPAPVVTIDVPGEVLVGEDFQFEVKFDNSTGAGVGYGPYIELYLPARGADGNGVDGGIPPTPQKCDGISFRSASTSFANPPTVTLPALHKLLLTNPGSLDCPDPDTAPFGITPFVPPLPSLPSYYQLVVIELPFGSFDESQPEIVVNVTAHLSDFADVEPPPLTPLTIYARGGFRYGDDALDNPPQLVESAIVSDQTTPAVFKLKKEYLGPEDEAVSGPNFINYYPLSYQLTADVADQQKISNLVITDILPNDLQFAGNVQVKIKNISGIPVTSCSTTSGPLGVEISAPPAMTPPPGLTLSVKLCSPITGSNASDDVVITFAFFIPDVDANGKDILDEDCKNSPVAVKNDILGTGDWDPLDPRDPNLSAAAGDTVPVKSNLNLTTVDLVLQAKCIAIQKTVSQVAPFTGGPGLTPGDTLRYELNFQVSDYRSIGKIVITDLLADGQLLSGTPTITVGDQFGSFTNISITPATFSDTPDPTISCGEIKGGTKLTFGVSSALIAAGQTRNGILTGGHAAGSTSPVPAKGQIIFHAKIQDKFKYQYPSTLREFVDKYDPLNNCVSIDGQVLKNEIDPTVPFSKLGNTTDDSGKQVRIAMQKPEKTVYAVKRGTIICAPTATPCLNLPGTPQEVRPGDKITFRIEYSIPSGDAEDLKIEDWLPLPVFDVGDPDAIPPTGLPAWPTLVPSCTGPAPFAPAPGMACRLSSHTVQPPLSLASGTANNLVFDNGKFNNPANTSKKIDLLFTVTVTNKPFADDLFLTNEAREKENNTFGPVPPQVTIAQIKLREPKLRIRKGVIATDNPNGEFSQPGPPPTANLATAQAPPNATLSLAGISGTAPMLSSNDLVTGILNSDLLGGVDANDKVTFAIVIENLGGAPAYDAKLEDILPSCFTNLSVISVKRGTGATVLPFLYSLVPSTGGTGFTITTASTPFVFIPPYHPTNGSNIVVITFQAQFRSDITPGCCRNEAKLLHYASQPGGPNFVPAGFGGPFKDYAEVCVKPKAEKCVVATSEVHTQADNSVSGTPQPPQVTIGEIVRYHLTMTLPEGVSPFFKVTDHLPPGMTYMPGTAKVAFVSTLGITSTAAGLSGAQMPDPVNYTLGCLKPNPTATIPSTLISPALFTPGDDPTFGLGILTNNDNDSNLEYVVIEFNALVNNVATNFDTVTLKNNYEIFLGKVVLGQTPVAIATSNDSDVNIVEPNFTMKKTVAPNPAVKGQTLTYTVQYTNNGSADAFNVELTDTLPTGLTFGTITAGCPFTNVPANTLTVTCAQIPKAPNSGSTVVVTYQAVANPATCPVKLNNQAKLTWTSLPGPQGTIGNATGSNTPGNLGAIDGERDGVTPLLSLNDYATTFSAAVKIDCPCEAMITGLKFNDLNGNGVRDTGEPGLANWTIQVTDSNGITHTTTTDSQGNYSFTVPAPGTYTVAEVLQSGWTQTAPTTGTHTVTVSPGQVVTNFNFGNKKKEKCDLQITKEVKPNPLVSGQQATATITVKNVGSSPCHGPTKVSESMPAGLTLVSASVPGGNCVVATGICTYPPAILPGASIVFTYVFDVTAQPGTKFENCAKLKNSEDKNPANNGTCVPLTVSDVKLPDLTIQKKVQCDGPAIPQGTCSVTFTISNNGPGAFNGILVIRDLVTPTPSPGLGWAGSSTPPGWSCGIGGPDSVGCATTSSVSLASGQSTSFSILLKVPAGQFKNCASVKGYTQFPYSASTLVQEGDFNNNESCVSMGGWPASDCVTPPPGMVAWWPLDEALWATTVTDIVGANNGTPQPGPLGPIGPSNSGPLPGINSGVTPPAMVGGSLYFYADRFARVPNAPSLNFGAGDFTIDAWVYPIQGGPTVIQPIVDKMEAMPSSLMKVIGYRLFILNGWVHFVVTDSYNKVDWAAPITSDKWHHVAAVRIGNSFKVYVDGVSTTAPFTMNSLSNSADLLIGGIVNLPGGGGLPPSIVYGNIAIDEVEIFDRALAQAEIESLFKAGSAGKCKTGSLTVTKTVENLSPLPIPAGTSFPVTVSCLASGPNVTLNLAAGGTQTVNNIPVGSKCTVTEGPLPARSSTPGCGSLQWAAPTYSPAQSVTIPNAGAPQTVTVQNRLVCSGRPPDDRYTFTPGMNEFCFWSGGGSFNSQTPIDNPNSQFTDFGPGNPFGQAPFPQTPFRNNTGGGRYGAIGLCYGRILTANDRFALKYTFNAIPVAALSYSEFNRVFIDRPGPGSAPRLGPVLVSETRRNVFGGGLSPIGFQLYFRPQSRIKPFVNTSGGFIFFKDQVPRLNGARFNFTYDIGGGVQVFRDAKRAFTLGYKYQRISNGGRALNNPGFDGHVFSFGYSIFK